MDKNGKANLRRLKTGLASATLAATLFNMNPILVQAEAIDPSIELHSIEDISSEEVAGEELTGKEALENNGLEEELIEESEEFEAVGALSNYEVRDPSSVESTIGAPEILNFEFDKTSFEVGEMVNFTVELKSKRSLDYVHLDFRSDDSTAQWGASDTVYVRNFTKNDAGNYVGHGQIRNNYHPGNYYLEYGGAHYNNGLYASGDFYNPSITYELKPQSETVDINLLDIEVVGKTSYKAGEKIQIKATLDDLTGVAYFSMWLKNTSIGNESTLYDLYFDDYELDADGNYVSYAEVINVSEDTFEGTYSIDSIFFDDINNVKKNFSYNEDLLDKPLFEVVDTGKTEESKVYVTDVSFNKEKYNHGEEIQAKIYLKSPRSFDELSLDIQSIDGRYSNDIRVYSDAIEKVGENQYIVHASFSLSIYDYYNELDEDTEYLIANIATRNYGHDVTLIEYNSEQSPRFTIYGEHDTERPSIVAVEVEKNQYRPSDTILFEVVAKDLNKVTDATLTFQNVEKGKSHDRIELYVSNFYKNIDGDYVGVGEYKIRNFMTNGQYELVSAQVTDISGNVGSLDETLLPLNLSFELVDGIVEAEGFELNEIQLNKESYKAGEMVELTTILKSANPLAYIQYGFSTETGDYLEEKVYEFVRDSNGNYVSTHQFLPLKFGAIYNLQRMMVVDIFSNVQDIDQDKFKNISLNVEDSSDKVAPIVENISIANATYRKGEEIEVTVTIADASEIDTFVMYYKAEGFVESYTTPVNINEFIRTGDGKLVGKGTMKAIIDYNESMNHVLAYIYVRDIMGNDAYVIDRGISEDVMIHPSENIDKPELISVKFDKEVYNPGDEIEITVVVNSSYDVDKTSLYFRSYNDSYKTGYPLEKVFTLDNFEATGLPNQYQATYNGVLDIPLFEYDSTYYLMYFNVYDVYHNTNADERTAIDSSFDVRFFPSELDETPIKQGWVEEESGWYYYDNGDMETGWAIVNGTWYYLDNEGLMATGWTQVGNTWYYLSGSGAMQTGWMQVGKTWYYMNTSGAMQTGWTKVGSTWYYMNSSGAMQTGWTKVGNTWYYLSGSGAMQTGWMQVGKTWYYMNTSGAMQTGWTKVGSTWYYMNSSGAMQTGWTKVGNTWYYMNNSGAMQTGWLKLGNAWYYLNSDGSMQTANARINGIWYKFDGSGRML